MLTGHLSSLQKIAIDIFPVPLQTILEFLKKSQLDTLDTGTYRILGDDIFLVLSEYETQSIEEKPSEKHNQYIDVHFMVSGEEYIGHGYDHPDNTVIQPYSPDNDCTLYSTVHEENFLLLKKGMFAVFLTHDAHRPGLHTTSMQRVKKVVVKIKQNLLHTEMDQVLQLKKSST